ncbi:unnamed protein product [Bemisia tabaci]|uniref:Uncharacterized protein n=1 Tax=Bemisia tabaci TaxID=7038 RepID=A0A9P0AN43_BEMTA|nr:unnamed protein product [Bemisia tabaci]
MMHSLSNRDRQLLQEVNDPLGDIENPCSRTKGIMLELKYFEPMNVLSTIQTTSFPDRMWRVADLKDYITLLTRETYEKLGPEEYDQLSHLKSCYRHDRTYYANSDSPSLWRLRSMFPHFALTEKMISIKPKIDSVNSYPKLHAAFYLPEFGGLIPSQKWLKKESREALILIHFFATERLKDLPLPPHIRHLLIKKHLESSFLSDDRRMHQLESLGLIWGGGNLKPETQCALNEINQREPTFSLHVNFNAFI